MLRYWSRGGAARHTLADVQNKRHAAHRSPVVVFISQPGGLHSVREDALVLVSSQLECRLHVPAVDGIKVHILYVPVPPSHRIHLSFCEILQPVGFLHTDTV